MLGVASVGVETRVEDGDLEAARAAGVQQAAENLGGFFPGEAAGVPVVDGRHQIVVENIDVEVYPEPRTERRNRLKPRHRTGA